ncbi:WAP domain-containing protein [Caerostris darwini]|uniref:WAP domain-containing protein n=1 Tax=Caerostris darwini TaxID=1538125 RepID=A0AAV4S3W9_9ARAC|nr:WAP domain-containing protein [Caerostris darwini]
MLPCPEKKILESDHSATYRVQLYVISAILFSFYLGLPHQALSSLPEAPKAREVALKRRDKIEISAFSDDKKWKCPERSPTLCSNADYEYGCKSHSDCPDYQLCCLFACSYGCVRPVPVPQIIAEGYDPYESDGLNSIDTGFDKSLKIQNPTTRNGIRFNNTNNENQMLYRKHNQNMNMAENFLDGTFMPKSAMTPSLECTEEDEDNMIDTGADSPMKLKKSSKQATTGCNNKTDGQEHNNRHEIKNASFGSFGGAKSSQIELPATHLDTANSSRKVKNVSIDTDAGKASVMKLSNKIMNMLHQKFASNSYLSRYIDKLQDTKVLNKIKDNGMIEDKSIDNVGETPSDNKLNNKNELSNMLYRQFANIYLSRHNDKLDDTKAFNKIKDKEVIRTTTTSAKKFGNKTNEILNMLYRKFASKDYLWRNNDKFNNTKTFNKIENNAKTTGVKFDNKTNEILNMLYQKFVSNKHLSRENDKLNDTKTFIAIKDNGKPRNISSTVGKTTNTAKFNNKTNEILTLYQKFASSYLSRFNGKHKDEKTFNKTKDNGIIRNTSIDTAAEKTTSNNKMNKKNELLNTLYRKFANSYLSKYNDKFNDTKIFNNIKYNGMIRTTSIDTIDGKTTSAKKFDNKTNEILNKLYQKFADSYLSRFNGKQKDEKTFNKTKDNGIIRNTSIDTAAGKTTSDNKMNNKKEMKILYRTFVSYLSRYNDKLNDTKTFNNIKDNGMIRTTSIDTVVGKTRVSIAKKSSNKTNEILNMLYQEFVTDSYLWRNNDKLNDAKTFNIIKGNKISRNTTIDTDVGKTTSAQKFSNKNTEILNTLYQKFASNSYLLRNIDKFNVIKTLIKMKDNGMIRNISLDAAVGKTMSSKKFSNKTNEILNTLYRKFANSYLARYDDKLNDTKTFNEIEDNDMSRNASIDTAVGNTTSAKKLSNKTNEMLNILYQKFASSYLSRYSNKLNDKKTFNKVKDNEMIRTTSMDIAVGKTISSKKFSNKANEILNMYRKFANSYLSRHDDKFNDTKTLNKIKDNEMIKNTSIDTAVKNASSIKEFNNTIYNLLNMLHRQFASNSSLSKYNVTFNDIKTLEDLKPLAMNLTALFSKYIPSDKIDQRVLFKFLYKFLWTFREKIIKSKLVHNESDSAVAFAIDENSTVAHVTSEPFSNKSVPLPFQQSTQKELNMKLENRARDLLKYLTELRKSFENNNPKKENYLKMVAALKQNFIKLYRDFNRSNSTDNLNATRGHSLASGIHMGEYNISPFLSTSKQGIARKERPYTTLDYHKPPAQVIPAVDLFYRNFKQTSSGSLDATREYNTKENIQQDKENKNIISSVESSKSTTGVKEFKHIITSTKRNNQKTSSTTQSTDTNYLLFKQNYFDISNNTIDYENSQYTQKRNRNIKTIIHPLMIFKSTTKREELKYKVADDQKTITQEYVTSGLNPNPSKINITNLVYKKHNGSNILNVIKGGKYKDNIRQKSMQNQNFRHPLIMFKPTSRQKMLSTKIPKVSLIYRAFAPINSSERFNATKTYEKSKKNQQKYNNGENVPLPFSTIKYISRKSDLKHITINHQKSSIKWSAHLNYTSKPKTNLLYRVFEPSTYSSNVKSTKSI